MADNLMSGMGDIRRSYPYPEGYGKYGLGSLPLKHSSKKYKCNTRCPFLTSKPSCACPHYLLERHSTFVIIKGEFGDGCPIYTKHLPARYQIKT